MAVARGADEAALTRSTPRYSSYVDAFDRSSSRVALSVPRMTSDAGFGPAYNTTPAADVTRIRQVVVDPDVDGMTRSAASGGNVAATRSIVQGPRRPSKPSGLVGVAR